jgi:hypothetical protein
MPQPVAYPTDFFNDAILPMTEKPLVSSVQYLGFAGYAMYMGLFGLSLARAHAGGIFTVRRCALDPSPRGPDATRRKLMPWN